MKNFFKISVLANVLLAAGVLWLVQWPHIVHIQPPSTNEMAPVAPASEPTATRPEEAARQASFRWSQLESPDYRIYIVNLRRIGCPEQTVRELVVADVDDLYLPRRQELQKKLAAGGQLALETELGRLQSEETRVIEELLGGQNSATTAAAANPTAAATNDPAPAPPPRAVRRALQEAQATVPPPMMPMAFADVDLQSLNLSTQQLGVFNEMRQDFVQEIGGPNQDPNDPAYLARWQAAQARSDAMMKAVLDPAQNFNYQMQVAAIRQQQQQSQQAR